MTKLEQLSCAGASTSKTFDHARMLGWRIPQVVWHPAAFSKPAEERGDFRPYFYKLDDENEPAEKPEGAE